jgi:hypothetical protein
MSEHWETGPAVPVNVPDDYPAPAPGPVTTWALRTPEGEPVGTLVWNEGGATWTFADTEDESAQAHGAEVLEYLRGHKAEGIDLADALDGIRGAYAGDLTES